MRPQLAVLVALGVVVAAVGVGLYATARPGPEPPGTSVAPPPTTPAEAAAPRSSLDPDRRVALESAMKGLDLIRPSRVRLAEDFTVPMPGGGRFRLADHRGKVVLVNFWATWCPPCREEMPAMERLFRRHRDSGFVMVAVSVDADPKVVAPFLKRHEFTFAVGLDPEMDLANAYGVRALPSSFVVDRAGHLTALALGPREWDAEAAHTLVAELTR